MWIQRRQVVGVERGGHHLVEVGRQRAPADAIDQRDVAVPQLEPGPRLVAGPGGIHFDMRFRYRRPGADGVEDSMYAKVRPSEESWLPDA